MDNGRREDRRYRTTTLRSAQYTDENNKLTKRTFPATIALVAVPSLGAVGYASDTDFGVSRASDRLRGRSAIGEGWRAGKCRSDGSRPTGRPEDALAVFLDPEGS